MALVYSFVVSIVYIAVWAAAVAAVINLPVSAPVKFLIFVLACFGYSLSTLLQQLVDRLVKIEYWAWMSFVTLNVRNEAEGLAPALERVQQDLNGESIERRLKGAAPIDIRFFIGGLTFFLIFLGAALDQGWFGPIAVNWVRDLWNWMSPPVRPPN